MTSNDFDYKRFSENFDESKNSCYKALDRAVYCLTEIRTIGVVKCVPLSAMEDLFLRHIAGGTACIMIINSSYSF